MEFLKINHINHWRHRIIWTRSSKNFIKKLKSKKLIVFLDENKLENKTIPNEKKLRFLGDVRELRKRLMFSRRLSLTRQQ